MPFLEEDEWQQISPLLEGRVEALKEYKQRHKCDTETAERICDAELIAKLKDLAGMSGINYETAIYHGLKHHRLKDWGEECPKCGYLLRTAQAKFCANCGWRKDI